VRESGGGGLPVRELDIGRDEDEVFVGCMGTATAEKD